LGPQDTAAGGLLKPTVSPSDCQSVSEGPQFVPSGALQVGSHHLWNMLLSTPRPKISRRLGAQDTTGLAAQEPVSKTPSTLYSSGGPAPPVLISTLKNWDLRSKNWKPLPIRLSCGLNNLSAVPMWSWIAFVIGASTRALILSMAACLVASSPVARSARLLLSRIAGLSSPKKASNPARIAFTRVSSF